MRVSTQTYFPKDFIETAEGLCFAVVQHGVEQCGNQEKVLCFLRYIKRQDIENRNWHKVSTESANAYLERHFPQYLHHSPVVDASLHGVWTGSIIRHHRPRLRLEQIMASPQRDPIEQDLFDLCRLYQGNGLDLSQVGVTGSVLIGVQQPASDIDLVFYDRTLFHKARLLTKEFIEHKLLDELDGNSWHESYARRSCALSLESYVWHERRKYNKALINSRKIDLNLVVEPLDGNIAHYKKCGAIVLQSKITDDFYSFDYPALFAIDNDEIGSVVCFTATYTGQGVIGETVEIAGLVEQADDGRKRIVVGSSREAPGEYIKVLACPD